MAVKKGEGEPFVAIIIDNSDSAKIISQRFLNNLELKKGRVEVHKEQLSKEKELSERLKSAACVIKLESCEVETTTQGVHIVTEDEMYNLTTRKFMQVLHPQFFIRIRHDQVKSKTMGYLIQKKVPAIGLLVSPVNILQDRHIEFTITGIRQVLGKLGMIDQSYVLRSLAVVKKNSYTAIENGVFEPKVEMFALVEKGDQIGILKTTGMPLGIKAKHDGKIIELARMGPVKRDGLLFSIGEPLSF